MLPWEGWQARVQRTSAIRSPWTWTAWHFELPPANPALRSIHRTQDELVPAGEIESTGEIIVNFRPLFNSRSNGPKYKIQLGFSYWLLRNDYVIEDSLRNHYVIAYESQYMSHKWVIKWILVSKSYLCRVLRDDYVIKKVLRNHNMIGYESYYVNHC